MRGVGGQKNLPRRRMGGGNNSVIGSKLQGERTHLNSGLAWSKKKRGGSDIYSPGGKKKNGNRPAKGP